MSKKRTEYELTPLGLLGPEAYKKLLDHMLGKETRDLHPAIVLDYGEDGKKRLYFTGVTKHEQGNDQ